MISSRNQKQSNEMAIMATADDAMQSKLSAVEMGYYKDPFLQSFASSSTSPSSSPMTRGGGYSNIGLMQSIDDGQEVRKNNMGDIGGDHLLFKNRINQRSSHHSNRMTSPLSIKQQYNQPLIRRGTFARTCSIDHAISSFLSICHLHIVGEDEDGDNNIGDRSAIKNDNNEHDDHNDYDIPEEIQIVVLGSGLDTSYLRAKAGLLHGNSKSKNAFEDGIMDFVKWYEIDFEDVIKTKYELLEGCSLFEFDCTCFAGEANHDDQQPAGISYAIKPKKVHTSISSTRAVKRNGDKTQTLNASTMLGLGGIQTNTSSEQYHLVGFDLRQPFYNLLKRLEDKHSFQFNVPTLFVMECVQMYIPEQQTRNILETITSTLQHPFVALFDPIIQNDTFGKVMVQNLTKAKIISNPSMSLLQCTTLQSQIDKLNQCGFALVTGCDFMTCYETVMDNDDRRKACMVEMLDEVEEWVLIMRHYCFVVASSSATTTTAAAAAASGRRKHSSSNIQISRLARKYCEAGNNACLGFKHGRCIVHGVESSIR